MRFVLASIVLFVAINGVNGFSVHVQQRSRNVALKYRELIQVQQRSRNVALKYRELDENDDDTAMLQVQTRAPPGFDMKDNLRKQRKAPAPKNALNMPLNLALLANQIFIVLVATVVAACILFFTDGFSAFSHLEDYFRWSGQGPIGISLTPERFGQGVVGSIPVIVLGNLLERSDNRAFANINFSTITMSMTLFGRRKAPPDDFLPDSLKGKEFPTTPWFDAARLSFFQSTLTGICEETVFRLYIAGLLNHFFGGYPIVPLFGSATLFSLGHLNRGVGLEENLVVLGLQGLNGLLFGSIYLFTGGDIVPCMVAHAIYDFTVFFNTWMVANSQLEYAENMYTKNLPPDVQAQVNKVLSKYKRIDPKVFKMVKRLFYTFDFDKNQTLSKSEVRKGFSYLAIEKKTAPPPQETIDKLFDMYTTEANKSRLSFSDFLRLYTKTEG